MTCNQFKLNISNNINTTNTYNHYRFCERLECHNLYLNNWMWLKDRDELCII